MDHAQLMNTLQAAQAGGRRRKASKKGSRKASKKGSRKASKKGSKKGSRKGSKRASMMGGKRKSSRKASKKSSRKASKRMAALNVLSLEGGKRSSRKASKKSSITHAKGSRKASKKGSYKVKRGLSEGMIQFQRLMAHVRSKVSTKNPRVISKAAAAARKVFTDKMPQGAVPDHKKLTDDAIKEFDANMDKYVKIGESA